MNLKKKQNHPLNQNQEYLKKLLNSLIKRNLEKRILRLEDRNDEQNKNITIIRANFKSFDNQIKSIIKNVEETKKIKEKEVKKKEASSRKGRIVGSKHSLANKSVSPFNKLKLAIKTDYNTNKIQEKKKLNINKSNLEKDPHTRAKSFKEKRKVRGKNINKGKIKLVKKIDRTLSSYINDDKKEDIKSKTMSNYYTEKKGDSNRNFNNTLNKKKKLTTKKDLVKSFSEADIKDKLKRTKEKSVKTQKTEKIIFELKMKLNQLNQIKDLKLTGKKLMAKKKKNN